MILELTEGNMPDTNNSISLSGRVTDGPEYSHTIYGEAFFKLVLLSLIHIWAQAVGCNIESYISFFGNLLFGLRTCAVLINKDRTGFCINSDIVAVRIVGVDDNAVCFFAADAAAVQKGVCKHAGLSLIHIYPL